MTAEGDAHALRHETGAVPAHALGRGGGGIAADPAHAAEDTVTATSRAPDTSKHRRKPFLIYTPVKEAKQTHGDLWDTDCVTEEQSVKIKGNNNYMGFF